MPTTRVSGNDIGLLVLRLGFAAFLIGFHGWTRLLRATHYVVWDEPWTFVSLVERIGFPFAPVFAVSSALAESLGALLVGFGVLTRLGALAIAINMGVAVVFELTNGDPIELPGLYLTVAIVLILTGGGRLTVAALRGR